MCLASCVYIPDVSGQLITPGKLLGAAGPGAGEGSLTWGEGGLHGHALLY
jgi:hypothetical protein